MEIPSARKSFYSLYVKRVLDIMLSGCGLIVFCPVFLVICILELVFHGRPVLYKSKRPGKDGKIFSIYKFRTMTNETDEQGNLLPESERLTDFGRFLRRVSLDEIPELFNILKGDMSVIGPRPLLVEYMELYPGRYLARQSVRPGFACVKLKQDGKPWTWRAQFENDVYYIENISFKLDVMMVFAVIRTVFEASDTRVEASRKKFDGRNLDAIDG